MSKPKFNPNQPFAPAEESAKPKFDPSKAFEESPEETSDTDSLGTSLYDLAKGAGQGVTLGGGDELIGAVKASLPSDEDSDWIERYRKFQQEAQKDYEEAKERSPVLTTVGEIGGGLALPVGALGMAGKGLAEGATLAAKAANLGTRMAATGAMGAAAGALGSKGNLSEDQGQLAEDALWGGGIGAASVPVMEGLGAIAKKAPELAKKIPGAEALGKFIDDSSILGHHKAALEEGLEGRTFFGKSNQKRMGKQAEEAGQSLQSLIENARDYATDKYGKVLEKVKSIDFTPEQRDQFENIESILSTASIRSGDKNTAILGTLKNIRSGEVVSGQKMKDLQKYLRDNASIIGGGESVDKLSQAAHTANEILREKVPGYKAVNEQFKNIEDVVDSFITNIPIGAGEKFPTKTSDALYKASKNTVKKMDLPFLGGEKEYEQFGKLQSGFKDLVKDNPEMLEALGPDDIGKYFDAFKKEARTQAAYRTASGQGQLNRPADLIGQGLSGTLNVSNLVGKTINTASNKANQLGNALYKMPTAGLSKVAERLQSDPATQHIGKALADSLANKSTAAKNAALFTILQNPDAKKAIGINDEENQE